MEEENGEEVNGEEVNGEEVNGEEVEIIPKKRRKDDDISYHEKHPLELDKDEIERLERNVLGDSRFMVKSLLEQEDEEDDLETKDEREPAWHDEDDDNITVEEALANCRHKPLIMQPKHDYQKVIESRYKGIVGTPSWASLNKKQEPNSDDEDDAALLQRCGAMVSSRLEDKLPRSILDIKRLASLNCQTMNEGRFVTSVEFHKTSTVALVAGVSGIVSILQVNGKGNDKLASIRFEKFPIKCAKFSFDGKQMYVGSNRYSHFYVYDLMEDRNIKVPLTEKNNMKRFEVSDDGKWIAVCGRFGDILLLSGRSKEQVATLHMNGNVSALAFSPDSTLLYAHGDAGEVWVFDVGRRSCTGRVEDEGCLEGTSLAASQRFLACGSSSGVVNLYDRVTLLANKHPKPLKAVMNLVTPVTSLRFDSSQQILAMASSSKDDSLKMLHLGSLTVFSNFPQMNSGLHKVQSVAFSPNGGYFSATNNHSTAFLYRLKHFGNY